MVALDPSTGAVKAMASVPGYDPNKAKNTSTFKQLNSDKSAPLVNRATQSTYPPGSTMKVVTAAAALDSGKFTPDSVLSGKSPAESSAACRCSNAGGEQFGDIDMTDRSHGLGQHLLRPGRRAARARRRWSST